MKRSLIFVLACAVKIATAQDASPVPEIPFESVPNFFKLPAGMNLGEAAGVALNSKHHIFIFTRGNTTGPAYGAAAAQLLEFSPDGHFIREIGKNLYAWSFAHAVRVDKNDNIWVIDKGSDMIVRFNPEGHVTMVFGRKKEASDEGSEPWKHVNPPRPPVDGQFRQPTDVTWDKAGDIFISDGYINSRVAKFDKNGRWVKSFGVPTPAEDRAHPKPGELNTPHSIAIDNEDNIYVADRGNRRIQVFDTDGNFERQITIDVPVPEDTVPWMGPKPSAQGAIRQSGAPWAICISPGPKQYLFSADAYPGRIYKLSLDGKVLGTMGTSGRQLKQFGWIHELACPTGDEVYAAEILNWRVQKLILNPSSAPVHHTTSTATPHKSTAAGGGQKN